MKQFSPLTFFKTTWQKYRPFVWFVLCLLLFHSVLKLIFYYNNHDLLYSGNANLNSSTILLLIKWSLLEDLLVVSGINIFLILTVVLFNKFSARVIKWIIIPVFVVFNSVALTLNLIDIFYFRFHFQRSNADLLFVLDNPLNRAFHLQVSFILLLVIGFSVLMFFVWFIHRNLFSSLKNKNFYGLACFLLLCLCVIFFKRNTLEKFLVPTYPMLQINSNELPIVQNSFSTFLFSIFRQGNNVAIKHYMPHAECDSVISINKTVKSYSSAITKKNIVLFIMESVPIDFFDTAGKFKVAMPFFDSLLTVSSFYDNAFCFAHESNKGITAVLGGIPTATDIPVYHSNYFNIPVTPIGKALHSLHYTSLFCIGDEYDNFGFAKCTRWLGIDNYYSMESISGYKKLPMHTMGLQDEYVLDFFAKKLNRQPQPFLGIQYNISTHYPYDIPNSFAETLPKNYTAAMKSMCYYDHSLQSFFNATKNEPWFNNTVFIFCSDHWMFPTGEKGNYNYVKGYKIPIIIFDPSAKRKKIYNQPVSQFDILGTILSIAGYKDSLTSYGGNLLDSSSLGMYTFTKPNENVYQVIDSNFVLGFNTVLNRTEYLFNYKKEPQLLTNLNDEKQSAKEKLRLTKMVEAFIQKTSNFYNNLSPKR